MAAKAVFRVPDVPLVADAPPKFQITAAQKKRAALMKKRSEIRIGMPRVLNMYSQTPVFTGYFAVARHPGREHRLLRLHQRGAVQGRRQARRHRPLLPLETRHSARAQPALQGARQEAARHHFLPHDRLPDHRSVQGAGQPLVPHRGHHARGGEGEGAKRGAIDPCFPSKLGIPHVHNLLYKVHAKKPLDIIFFPMIDCLTSDLHSVQASRSCPTVATTPEAVKAAFTKEGDLFAEKGVLFLDTFVNLSKPDLFERQMYEQFKDILGLSPEENHRAVEQGYRALDYFQQRHHARRRARGAGATGARRPTGRGAAGPAVSQRPGREPRDPGGVPEARLPGVRAGLPAHRRRHHLAPVRRRRGSGRDSASHGHHRRLEELLQREHQPQGVGRQVRGAASQPGGAGAFQLQVRPRRAHLHRGGRDRGAFRHAVLLLQGYRREQAHRLDPDPRRDHRLLPEALPRRHGAQQAEGQDASKQQFREFEARLRRQMLREKLDAAMARARPSRPARCRRFT